MSIDKSDENSAKKKTKNAASDWTKIVNLWKHLNKEATSIENKSRPEIVEDINSFLNAAAICMDLTKGGDGDSSSISNLQEDYHKKIEELKSSPGLPTNVEEQYSSVDKVNNSSNIESTNCLPPVEKLIEDLGRKLDKKLGRINNTISDTTRVENESKEKFEILKREIGEQNNAIKTILEQQVNSLVSELNNSLHKLSDTVVRRLNFFGPEIIAGISKDIKGFQSTLYRTSNEIERITTCLDGKIDMRDAESILELRSKAESSAKSDILLAISAQVMPVIQILQRINSEDQEALSRTLQKLYERCAKSGLIPVERL